MALAITTMKQHILPMDPEATKQTVIAMETEDAMKVCF
jgi:hypothetical protein